MTFDPTAYGPAVLALLGDGTRLMPLGPGTPNESLRAKLAAIDLPPAVRSALYLYHDFLDESHTISQDLATPTGSFLHAVMHRREPDAWNSKYWWNRVGPHPVLKQLVEAAPAVGYGYTTPQAFVDLCERVRGSRSADEATAERVQRLEWQLLFDSAVRSSTSERP